MARDSAAEDYYLVDFHDPGAIRVELKEHN